MILKDLNQVTFDPDEIWQEIQREATEIETGEPVLAPFLRQVVGHSSSLPDVMSVVLADKLSGAYFDSPGLRDLLDRAFAEDPGIVKQMFRDLAAFRQRDPASPGYLGIALFYKGFHALSAYRVSHHLWNGDQRFLAAALQSSISEHLGVDIHPAARIGSGVMIDHATGVVIGETAVVEDDVSMLHTVTLGGTGKERGDRHPKVRRGVLIGAGAKILGNVEIGEGAKIGAGSVVLRHVPPHSTVVGVPAHLVGCPEEDNPALNMDHRIQDSRHYEI